MPRRKKALQEPDVMDGAIFPWSTHEGKTPADYMTGESGYRPDTPNMKPSGTIFTDLRYGIKDKIIPPKKIWDNGDWKSLISTHNGWDVWVVSGEGSPGNYLFREYRLPHQLTSGMHPRHPSLWSKKMKEEGEGKPKTTTGGGSGTSWGSQDTGPKLPLGLRVRCTGCGHFFKVDDLPAHAKNACPATQDPPIMWIIRCECHEGLLEATEILEGFPYKPPETPKPPDGPPDMSGVAGGDDSLLSDLSVKEGGDKVEVGGSSQPESEEGTAA
jgi:hypothetical protein